MAEHVTEEMMAKLRKLEKLIPPAPWKKSETHGMDVIWLDIEDSEKNEILSAESMPTPHIVAEKDRARMAAETDKGRNLIKFVVELRNAASALLDTIDHQQKEIAALVEFIRTESSCHCLGECSQYTKDRMRGIKGSEELCPKCAVLTNLSSAAEAHNKRLKTEGAAKALRTFARRADWKALTVGPATAEHLRIMLEDAAIDVEAEAARPQEGRSE